MQIDFLAELEPFRDRFQRSKVVDNKLNSCSPFRQDHNPSFVLFLDKGNWVDSGTNQRGNFAELLAYLSGDSIDAIRRGLIARYSDFREEVEQTLDLQLKMAETVEKPFQNGLPKDYLYRHDYLSKRGVSEKVQKAFKIGFDRSTGSVVLPWCNKGGEIVRLQFRSVKNKVFWFSKEGDRIKNHLFGLNHVYNRLNNGLPVENLWIVEAPIDCLYLWSLGKPAVATGTASISKEQVKLLKQCPVENLIVASDNDEAGANLYNKIVTFLGGVKSLKRLSHPSNCKDVNDMTPEQINASNFNIPDLFTMN